MSADEEAGSSRAAAAAGAPAYAYTQLADVRNTSRINCFGVVDDSQYGEANGNCSLKCSVVDESLAAGQRVRLRVYAACRHDLPDVRAPGDIIRVHRFKAQRSEVPSGTSGGYIALISGLIDGTNGCHSVTWDGRHGGSVEPRSASSRRFTMSPADGERVVHLRNWWAGRARQSAAIGRAIELAAILPKQYADCVAQVIGRFDTISGTHVLRIADGTCVPFPATKCGDSEIDVGTAVVDANASEAFTDIAYDVFIYDQDIWDQCLQMNPGAYVLMANLHVYVPTRIAGGRASFVMHTVSPGSRFYRAVDVLSDDDRRIDAVTQRLSAQLAVRLGDASQPKGPSAVSVSDGAAGQGAPMEAEAANADLLPAADSDNAQQPAAAAHTSDMGSNLSQDVLYTQAEPSARVVSTSDAAADGTASGADYDTAESSAQWHGDGPPAAAANAPRECDHAAERGGGAPAATLTMAQCLERLPHTFDAHLMQRRVDDDEAAARRFAAIVFRLATLLPAERRDHLLDCVEPLCRIQAEMAHGPPLAYPIALCALGLTVQEITAVLQHQGQT